MCVDYYVEKKEWVTICTNKNPVLMNSVNNKKVPTEVTTFPQNESVISPNVPTMPLSTVHRV